MTTRYNLQQKFNKRMRQICALNALLSDLAAKPTPLTLSEKRRIKYAWRSLKRAWEDAYATREAMGGR